MDEMERPYHPIADIFPLMQGDEYDKLKSDIAGNGLLQAIWLHPDGSIIDGRNRHRACLDTDTPPHFKTWDGAGSLVLLVVSLNLHRRHLSSSQRAVVALEILPHLEAKAKETQGKRNDLTSVNKFTEVKRSTQQAAKITGTNQQYISDAKRIKQEAPELVEEIAIGNLTIPQAKRRMVKDARKEAPPLPDGKYRVIYADPPWSYGNSGIIGETDNYGHVERHYPSMTITELCSLPVRSLVDNDAVLFLWVTSPLLAECWPVINAWGFKYKTSFVWDKIKHNYGHYNSVRHELLLICTRGSCTPDVNKLFDSVQSIERSDKHSEKPEAFRTIIDTIYPNGLRIELFSRSDTDGWEAWGNENDH